MALRPLKWSQNGPQNMIGPLEMALKWAQNGSKCPLTPSKGPKMALKPLENGPQTPKMGPIWLSAPAFMRTLLTYGQPPFLLSYSG